MVHKKKKLDSKVCIVCKKEFFWRKKNGKETGLMLNIVLKVVQLNLLKFGIS